MPGKLLIDLKDNNTAQHLICHYVDRDVCETGGERVQTA